MFSPKAVHAQIADVCYERERRGEPAYEVYMGKEQIYTIPMGAICFCPDLEMKSGDLVPQYARIQDEPILIATDNADEFVYVSKNNGGDIQMFSIEEDMEPNYSVDGEDEYYVLVVHGLNFCFSDALAPSQAQNLSPVYSKLVIEGDTNRADFTTSKTAVSLSSTKAGGGLVPPPGPFLVCTL